jgi:hypothetical protein
VDGQEGCFSGGGHSGTARAGFLLRTDVLLASHTDDEWHLRLMEGGKVKLIDVECDVSLPRESLGLKVVLKTGLLGRITVIAKPDAGSVDTLPGPYDAFLMRVKKDAKLEGSLFTLHDSLNSFSGEKPSLVRFAEYSATNLGLMASAATSAVLLPGTLGGVAPESASPSSPYRDFIDCLPGLLVYAIGMKVDAANNFEREGLSVADHLVEFGEDSGTLAEYAYFLLLLHKRPTYSEHLKHIQREAANWAQTPGRDTLRSFTQAWRAFAHAVRADSAAKQDQAVIRIYMAEQIAAVDKRF